jgi:TetR/AcrR family transcriptional regulator, transcriptional repressor for nem operon
MARPRSFDPEEALEQAKNVFWLKGYEATSVTDLTKAMGINKFSLYATFDDKRSLFLKSLQHYRKTSVAEQFACLQNGAGIKGIEQFFDQVLHMPAASKAGGCLMMNSLVELSGQDPEIDKAIRQHFTWVEAQFHRALRDAQANGDLARGVNIDDKAQALMALVQGVIALSKAKFGRKAAEAAVRDGLAALTAVHN